MNDTTTGAAPAHPPAVAFGDAWPWVATCSPSPATSAMLRALLICGLIARACAGVLGFGFARVAAEGPIEAAIAFEETAQAGAPAGHDPVSRETQRGVGLLTATIVYGVAIGGIFALVFAAVYGRVFHASPARTAAGLAGLAFVVVFLIPFAKYLAMSPRPAARRPSRRAPCSTSRWSRAPCSPRSRRYASGRWHTRTGDAAGAWWPLRPTRWS